MSLQPGEQVRSFTLPDATTGDPVSDPWRDGPVVLAFFKVTCPVCQLAAPKVQALADGGARVVGIGQDPPPKLTAYAERYGQRVATLSEPPPYLVAGAYGVRVVPTLFLVDGGGILLDAVVGWDRQGWNRVAAAAGGRPVSREGDGLPSFRPG